MQYLHHQHKDLNQIGYNIGTSKIKVPSPLLFGIGALLFAIGIFFTFLLLALWHLSRSILTAAFEENIEDFMQSGIIQGLAFISIIAGSILIGMLFIICNAHRLEIELLHARKEIKTLTGLLPICSSCKKIRTDKGEWQHIENYISSHSEAFFTHGICPSCQKKLYPEY